MQTSTALTTTIDLPQADRGAVAAKPTRPFWRRLFIAYVRYIAKCQAARQEKVNRALREGLTNWP